jgi:nuclear transport factor 2 (NTF2) superfamily protein
VIALPFTLSHAAKASAGGGCQNYATEAAAVTYSEDSVWAAQSEFVTGRVIRQFLAGRGRELEYRLVKDLWAFTDDRIAVRFQYEWHDVGGHWHHSYGNRRGSSTKAV